MVSISLETIEQTASRLERVIRSAKLQGYPEPYIFQEFPLDGLQDHFHPEALAFVRDDERWSALIPAKESAGDKFAVWRFHFPEGLDNSGFVGWLASKLKTEIGTGVFVVCGQNSHMGGIFDYWGCPWDIRKDAYSILSSLTEQQLTDSFL